MWWYILSGYVLLNLVLACWLHFFTLRHGERPSRTPEIVVYFAVFAIVGIPLFILFNLGPRRA